MYIYTCILWKWPKTSFKIIQKCTKISLKHIKRSLIPFTVRKIQIYNVRYHISLNRLAKLKNIITYPLVRLWGNRNSHSLLLSMQIATILEIPNKLHMLLPFDSGIPLWRIYLLQRYTWNSAKMPMHHYLLQHCL